ncbi:hypothetical protein CPB86DRAFT_673802, partial [Serendipita vermifera]
VSKNPDCQLMDMQEYLSSARNLTISLSTIWRTLDRLGWSMKTVTKAAREQDIEKQARYIAEVSEYHAHELVFIDES